jgi:hypothetical protein
LRFLWEAGQECCGDWPWEDVVAWCVVADVEGEDRPSWCAARVFTGGVKRVTVEDEGITGFAEQAVFVGMRLILRYLRGLEASPPVRTGDDAGCAVVRLERIHGENGDTLVEQIIPRRGWTVGVKLRRTGSARAARHLGDSPIKSLEMEVLSQNMPDVGEDPRVMPKAVQTFVV